MRMENSLNWCYYYSLAFENDKLMISFMKLCRLSSLTRLKNVYVPLSYEGCSNMNASGFITLFTYMLRHNGKRFYKGLYVTFKLVPDLKTNTVYLSSYSPWKQGHVSILTNLML